MRSNIVQRRTDEMSNIFKIKLWYSLPDMGFSIEMNGSTLPDYDSFLNILLFLFTHDGKLGQELWFAWWKRIQKMSLYFVLLKTFFFFKSKYSSYKCNCLCATNGASSMVSPHKDSYLLKSNYLKSALDAYIPHFGILKNHPFYVCIR